MPPVMVGLGKSAGSRAKLAGSPGERTCPNTSPRPLGASPTSLPRRPLQPRPRWRFDGGAEVPASSSPSVVRVPFSDPAGVDPEEALVAALSSCHMLFFLDFAKRGELRRRSYDDAAEGVDGEGRGRASAMTRVTLKPADPSSPASGRRARPRWRRSTTARMRPATSPIPSPRRWTVESLTLTKLKLLLFYRPPLVKHMLNQSLDLAFQALGDPTRRAIVARLARGR